MIVSTFEFQSLFLLLEAVKSLEVIILVPNDNRSLEHLSLLEER